MSWLCEEAEVDRLVAILKTNICGGDGGANRVEYSKQPEQHNC